MEEWFSVSHYVEIDDDVECGRRGATRKATKLATFLHLRVRLPRNPASCDRYESPKCEFPPTSLIRKEIELLCEVPAKVRPSLRGAGRASILFFFLPRQSVR